MRGERGEYMYIHCTMLDWKGFRFTKSLNYTSEYKKVVITMHLGVIPFSLAFPFFASFYNLKDVVFKIQGKNLSFMVWKWH